MPRKKNKTADEIKTDEGRIFQLIDLAWESSSPERTLAIAEQILEINPNRVEGLILKADHTDDTQVSVNCLKKALSALKNPDNCLEGDKNVLFLTINQRLALAYLKLENFDEAFEYCKTAIKFYEKYLDADDVDVDASNSNILMKNVYYKILIERKAWQQILQDSMRDPDITLGRAYARLLAAWFITPENPGGNRSVCANLFWDAIAIAPNVPFYITNYFEEPDDNAPPEAMEEYRFALMYYDIVSITDDFSEWFVRGILLFGLFSGRFEERERDYVIDALDDFGGYGDYEKMKKIIVGTEDSEVIEALAANKCLAN